MVVTGMGVVSCLGHTADEFYDNLLAGKSGVSLIEGFDASDYPTVRLTLIGPAENVRCLLLLERAYCT